MQQAYYEERRRLIRSVLVEDHLPTWIQAGLTSDIAFVFLFAIFILEGAMLLYVVPSELIVPASLLLMGDSYLNATLIILVAVVGATVGQVCLFAASRYLGRDKLLASRWVPISDDQMTKFEGWFDTYGQPAVPATNSLLLVRGTMTIPAGLSGMTYRRFGLLSAIGTLVFETALAVLYYIGIVIFI